MATKYIITPGFRSHFLTAVRELPHVRGKRYWLFRCDCGVSKRINAYPVLSGDVKSCGCQRGTLVAFVRTRHSNNRRSGATKEYKAWKGMWARCTLPSQQSYKYYGAIGISVCDRWMIFDNFIADIGPAPSPAHSIYRINPFGNYEPTNCRWATIVEQRANRRQEWNKALAAD